MAYLGFDLGISGVRDGLEARQQTGAQIDRLIAVGGGSRSVQ
ncbi:MULTISPECIES: hypothetical protein [Marinovum]|jgi:sugar (pentulose or hexulose) kinase|nr:hypothetical protein [Marinovum sp. PR37]MDD9743454.1 hypothetical protein [Marinovum sp. PR37]